MNVNVIGGALGAAALIAILVLHGCENNTEPVPAPQVTIKPAPKVTPKAAVKPSPAPNPKAAGTEYQRVGKGGKLDGTITCTAVRDYVAGKSQAELAALAKEYGVTTAQLAKYKQCVR